ncbi:hypothetical protein MCG01_05410 [Enterococcus hirae]|nr:hypothetical protein [Enterococcus faecium]MCH1976566.1 hypothetical protein [Enterococcus hirae]
MFKLFITKMMFSPVVAAVNANNTGKKIAESFQWLIAGGGFLLAIWGIVQITQAGRQGDSQGKMEGSWLILGGILLLGVAAGTMITGVFSNPPGM